MADYNGDGAPDIAAVTNLGASAVNVFLSQTTKVTTVPRIDLCSGASARKALEILKAQLSRIGQEQAALGAFESRVTVALSNLFSSRENYEAAASRITDVDVAEESAAFLKNQIIQQAGASVLSQANMQPKLALALLTF